MNLAPPKTNDLPALTGLRAIAAWMVFAHHFNPFSKAASPTLYGLTHAMHTGVSVFFVLSGMLIYYRYQQVGATAEMKGYFIRRFAKIYPLFLLLTIITFLVEPPKSWFEGVANLLLVQGYFSEFRFNGIAQAWSLSVEETFYVLAPLLFFFIRPLKKDSNWSFVIKCVAIFGVAVALWKIGSFIATASQHKMHGFMEGFATYTFFGRSLEFGVGIMMAVALQAEGNSKRGTSQTWAGGVLFVLVLFAIAAFESWELVINNFILPCATGLLLLGLAQEKTWLAKILSSTPMQWLGKSSYALYLIHIGVIQAALSDWVSTNTLVLFVLLNAIAIGLYIGVERPLQRWILQAAR